MIERRAKHKPAARATPGQALGIFEHLGAPLWAGKARQDKIPHRTGRTASLRPGKVSVIRRPWLRWTGQPGGHAGWSESLVVSW
jgi:hypothetical protein